VNKYKKKHNNKDFKALIHATAKHAQATAFKKLNPHQAYPFTLVTSEKYCQMSGHFSVHCKSLAIQTRSSATTVRHVCAMFHKVWKIQRFHQQRKMTFKVIQMHWQWCHLISHIQFPI